MAGFHTKLKEVINNCHNYTTTSSYYIIVIIGPDIVDDFSEERLAHGAPVSGDLGCPHHTREAVCM